MNTIMLMALAILYAKCFIAVLLGLVIHTGTKFQEVKQLHVKANESYGPGLFFKTTIVSQIINIASVLIWMLVLPDVIKAVPTINGSVVIANIAHILGCAVIGWANSSIVLKLFGSGTKYIMDQIDKKTNIADGK